MAGMMEVAHLVPCRMSHNLQCPNSIKVSAQELPFGLQDSVVPGDQYAAEATWSNLFHHHPLQHHHSSYRYMLSKQQRQRGISHFGSAERLRLALSRAITSKLHAATSSYHKNFCQHYQHSRSNVSSCVDLCSMPRPEKQQPCSGTGSNCNIVKTRQLCR
jgi:hypothetical protein